MTTRKKKKLSAVDVGAATASALSGMVFGIKAGAAIGSLFGPFGLAFGPIIGAMWGQTAFMNRTMASPEPLQQAARDAARVLIPAVIQPPEFPPIEHKCPSSRGAHE